MSEADAADFPSSPGFSYEELDEDVAQRVQEKTTLLRQFVQRTVEDLINVGRTLREVKAELEHGQFGRWLNSEFAWTDRTARNLMALSDAFNIHELEGLKIPPSALYVLADAPQAARTEALDQARSGKKLTATISRKIVSKYRAPKSKGSKNVETNLRHPTEGELVVGSQVQISSILHGDRYDNRQATVLEVDGLTVKVLPLGSGDSLNYPIEGLRLLPSTSDTQLESAPNMPQTVISNDIAALITQLAQQYQIVQKLAAQSHHQQLAVALSALESISAKLRLALDPSSESSNS
jgi:Protein of unknown function (DUF3102)